MVHVQSFKLRLYQNNFFFSREQKILTSRSYLKARPCIETADLAAAGFSWIFWAVSNAAANLLFLI
jgi:hypothetical protein